MSKNNAQYENFEKNFMEKFKDLKGEELLKAACKETYNNFNAAGETLLNKEAEVNALKAENKNLKASNKGLQEQNRTLNTENQKVKAENQKVKAESQNLKAENKGLEAENKGLKAGKASLEKELDKSKAETTFLKSENGKLKEHNTKLQQQPKTREEVKKARKQAEIDAKAEKKAAKTQKKVEKAENKKVRFKASNDKVSEKTITSAKDKIAKSNVVLKAKNSYRSRFQKTRAVLKTVNSVTLKPAAQFTMKQFKQRKQTYGVIKDKVTTELKKKGIENPSAGQYRAKFAQVATAKAGKKVMNKVANTTLKDVWNKVTGVYKGSIEADKAKVAANNKQIEQNNVPKQAKIDAKATIKAEKSLSI
ncbi:hypothetical protein [Priestia megaterium]|uniref:hypothetical protein n=1 Tax=Priestia megaterium TaxID=1404 RepID=UPI0031012584